MQLLRCLAPTHLRGRRLLTRVLGRWPGVHRFRQAICNVSTGLLVGLFATSAQAAPTSITEYPVEVGHATNIDHLGVSADDTVWFADGYWPEGGSFHALVGRRDSSGEIQEFDEGLGDFSVIRGFIAAPDGNMWFTDSGSAGVDAAIGKVTPDGDITEYGGLDPSRPQGMILGPDGALWFTASSSPAIGRATLAGSVGTYSFPGAIRDLAVGSDGNVWFTYGGGSVEPAIGRFERKEDGSATATLFHSGLSVSSKPGRMVAAGGYLWFSDESEAEPAVGRVSADGQITEFRTGLASNSYITDLEPGPEGAVWFMDNGAGAVGRISPTGQISEFTDEYLSPDPGLWYAPGRVLQHLVAGPDGNMWFSFSSSYAGVGKVSPSGEITIFRGGEDGLSFNSSPQEIAVGTNGDLWFVSNTGVTTQSIGHIVPGDDSPPSAPENSGETPWIKPPGQIVLQGQMLRADRHEAVHPRLLCESAIPCLGRLSLAFLTPRHRVVGSVPFSINAGVARTVSIRLNRLGRKLLPKERRHRGELSVFPLSDFTMTPQRVWVFSPRRLG